jgi:septum formation protein
MRPGRPNFGAMLFPNLRDTRLVLASKSPRRVQLLEGLGVPFDVRTREVNEQFPPHLRGEEIPLYLAKLKADAFADTMQDDELVITADTVVWVNDHVLNKPADENEAMDMLRELSGRTHTVYTAVCLSSRSRTHSFFDATHVSFVPLGDELIRHYVDTCRPFDKAGAYGAQEMIGYIAIDRIEGSYFNVMGLPIHKLFAALREW